MPEERIDHENFFSLFNDFIALMYIGTREMLMLPCSFFLQSLERDLQTRVRENADLQQQLSRKEAKLTRAEETIGREQQQIQELREQV